jgi:amidase
LTPHREPIEHPQLWENLLASLVDIGLGTLSEILGMTDEPIFPSMAPFLAERVTAVEDGVGPEKLQMLGHQRARLQKEYLERWQATAKDGKAVMDGIIMAASPWAACPLGTVDKAEYFGYAGVFNPLGESPGHI